MKTVTAAEANRQFSAVLREVARGRSVLITSRGKPVATIAPATRAVDAARALAKSKLFERLQATPPSGIARDWSRDDLYE